MYPLIKKDFLIQKKTIKLSMLLMLFFTMTLSNLGPAGLTVGILAIAYQLILGASALDDKNNSDMLLVSLPIKKQAIVLAKYLSIFVFTFYAIVGYFVIYILIQLLQLPIDMQFTATAIIGGIVSNILYCSISFPLIFKYGYLKAKMINLILFFVFVSGGTAVASYFSLGEVGQDSVPFILQISLVLSLLMVLTLSYFLSLAFYRKREF